MEDSQEPHDGFPNYQTWCVNWWLTNYREVSQRCRELVIQATNTVREASGIGVGIGVGTKVGMKVGSNVGSTVGSNVGSTVGSMEGS